MVIDVRKLLFAWDELDSSPTLATLCAALEAILDGPLLAALQARRHHGCDTSPVSVLWGVLLLAILLRHPTTEACLDELRRHAPPPPARGGVRRPAALPIAKKLEELTAEERAGPLT